MSEDLRLVTGEYPPFTSQQIPGGGVVTEIVKLVFSAMKYDLKLDFLPWKRGYVLTKQNKYVATFPYLTTNDRTKEFLYSNPIIEWQSKVYVRVDSGIDYHSDHDLVGHTECLPHHYGSIPELDALHLAGKIKRIRPPHIKSCWLMVLNGRADFFVEDIFVADIFRKEILAERSKEVIELKKTISRDYGYLILPKSSPRSEELVFKFNETLAGLTLSGDVTSLKREFLNNNIELVDLMN